MWGFGMSKYNKRTKFSKMRIKSKKKAKLPKLYAAALMDSMIGVPLVKGVIRSALRYPFKAWMNFNSLLVTSLQSEAR